MSATACAFSVFYYHAAARDGLTGEANSWDSAIRHRPFMPQSDSLTTKPCCPLSYVSSFFPCSLEIHALFLCVVLSSPSSRGVLSLSQSLCTTLSIPGWWGAKGWAKWKISVTRLCCSPVLLVPGCWQHKKTGRGRMPCSWKMSAGGKGAAHKAHRCIRKRHVPTLFHEAGVPFEQAKSDGISSAETWGSCSFSPSGNVKALNQTKMYIWFVLFSFPTARNPSV